jgi:uncharacterized protein YciI
MARAPTFDAPVTRRVVRTSAPRGGRRTRRLAPAQPKEFAVTKFLAINTVKPLTPAQAQAIMRDEVEATARQYLEGKIEQFWGRLDGPGGVVILNTSSREEAQSWLDALPLTREGFLTYQLIPIGPLSQLNVLLQDAAAETP